jgi:hypothetical protein
MLIERHEFNTRLRGIEENQAELQQSAKQTQEWQQHADQRFDQIQENQTQQLSYWDRLWNLPQFHPPQQ